jgi:hypothetical protein
MVAVHDQKSDAATDEPLSPYEPQDEKGRFGFEAVAGKAAAERTLAQLALIGMDPGRTSLSKEEAGRDLWLTVEAAAPV